MKNVNIEMRPLRSGHIVACLDGTQLVGFGMSQREALLALASQVRDEAAKMAADAYKRVTMARDLMAAATTIAAEMKEED